LILPIANNEEDNDQDNILLICMIGAIMVICNGIWLCLVGIAQIVGAIGSVVGAIILGIMLILQVRKRYNSLVLRNVDIKETSKRTKNIYLEIRNRKDYKVQNIKTHIRVNGRSSDFEPLRQRVEPFNLEPRGTLLLPICRIGEDSPTTIGTTNARSGKENIIVLNKGGTCYIDLEFFGDNFISKKIYHLVFDHNSFKECNVRIRTRFDWLKEVFSTLKSKILVD